jgi:elongation factor 3
VLEKATRVLTDAEKAQLEVEFVGKNGQKRKMEVRELPRLIPVSY